MIKMVLTGFKFVVAGFMILMLDFFGQLGNLQHARERMVTEQIESRGVRNRLVLDAMRTVPRHLFVPDEYRDYAYYDRPLPIGYEQTISQPFIVAYMTELLHPKATDKVLEIGTGSGYQAAVLAEMVDQVYTVEIVEPLGKEAAERLEELHYDNIHVKIGDGYEGWTEFAPYDAIIVTAAADSIPPLLVEQLKDGGRMVLPVGGRYQTQMLKLVKKKNQKVVTQSLIPVRFVPFVHDD